MTEKEIHLYSELIGERYGEVVKSVGTHLLKQLAPLPIPIIARALNLSTEDVRPALSVLLNQNLAEVSISKRGNAQFTAKCEKMYPLLIQPLCIVYAKERFGSNAELLLNELYFEPGICMSETIKRVIAKLQSPDGQDYTPSKIEEVKEAFVQLAENKLIQRCCDVTMLQEDKVPIKDQWLYLIPEFYSHLLEKLGNVDNCMDTEAPPAKKARTEEEFPDKDIFWEVNSERFEVHLRNEIIIDAASNVVDKKAADIVRAICDKGYFTMYGDNKLWMTTSPPVSYYEILRHLKNMDGKELELYLSVLSDGEYQFVCKVDDRSGGMYVANTSKVIFKLMETAAAEVVKEKFGSKYSRIFRLLIKEKYLEHKQIGEHCMIPTKDAENYIYELMEQSYVTTKAIAKTPDYAPKKTIYLFHVDLMAVCRMLLQTCYQSLYNTLCFFDVYRKNNTRLVEKKLRLDAIITTLELSGADEAQIEEVAQMITPLEKETLAEVDRSCIKLNKCVCQLTEMVVLLKSYLNLAVSK